MQDLQHKSNIFEKHPTLSILVILAVLLALLYGLFSIKCINNRYTEFEAKNLKTMIKQYYVANMIDQNIGRFIKLREHAPLQQRKERPTRHYVQKIPGVLERKYYALNTDADGFIAPSHIHEMPDAKIVFLGGSTTECLYMEETERFPYLVGRSLEKATGLKINSYNGGVSANESMHSINILLNKVLAMKPQAVVLMHNINDLVMLRLQGTYWYQTSLKSHLQSSKNVFTRFEYPPNDPAVSNAEIEEAFKRNLETFIAICNINNIVPVLMTQANRVEDDVLYHRFNDIIREIGLAHKITVIDLAQQIPRNLEMMYDSYHYTAKGSAFAARIISRELEYIFAVKPQDNEKSG
ncbi:SGNH/GDSL hydrolase family protein [Candidatus Berkiella cookevillensis]|uniref:SGNH/GDSL hydrolase family protein n=1 Tax=Candidatus Berkiella cookevillensis TaxID=437022 RepID=A0A0Q9YMD4_9GAMM|nr:SGNH/GDSL hydrolase family protein [Candidatus Berkiella cookevillensis]MCS5709161.1 SGNH/GDSL hydrolase family protein [Candidatus Berkiella cookevillensis]